MYKDKLNLGFSDILLMFSIPFLFQNANISSVVFVYNLSNFKGDYSCLFPGCLIIGLERNNYKSEIKGSFCFIGLSCIVT